MSAPVHPRKSFHQIWQEGIRGKPGWLWILAGAAEETLKPDTALMASAIAYFALFSLFPTGLLSISFASYSLGNLMNQQLILQRLEFVAPDLSQLLGQNLDIALFMLFYTLLPHGASTWHEIMPGAIAAGILWELAKKAFLLFASSYISI